MRKSVRDSIEILKDDDLVTLYYLYFYRAMDVEQLMKRIYHVDTSTSSGKRARTIIVKRLQSQSVVTVSKYLPGREALQITNKGIEIVRYTKDIPNEVYDPSLKSIKKGYYTAADLHQKDQFLNHQIHMNQFMLDFEEKALPLGLHWKYSDEKFLSDFFGMRPDGLITTLDTDFFIEIDMATESRKQLLEKWQHYREFMQTNEFLYKSRKIIVLFDCDNLLSKKKIKNRVDLVKQTLITELLDKITGDFDVVIGPRHEMVDYIFNTTRANLLGTNIVRNNLINYLQKDLGYTLSFGWDLNKQLAGDFYNYYVRKLTPDHQIEQSSGVVNEFFLDFYTSGEMSVLHRINWYERNRHLWEEKFGRRIKLIVAVNSINDAFDDFKLLGEQVLGNTGIFLIDVNDYNVQEPLYKNVYQLGTRGEVYKITTPDYSRRKFVRIIKEDKKINHKRGRIKQHARKTS